MKRVIGLGGPFLKANDPKALAAWYEKHLGIAFGGGTYTVWPFADLDAKPNPGFNILSFFPADSVYFNPAVKETMINFIFKGLSVP